MMRWAIRRVSPFGDRTSRPIKDKGMAKRAAKQLCDTNPLADYYIVRVGIRRRAARKTQTGPA